MQAPRAAATVRFLASLGDRYASTYLTHLDVPRFKGDRNCGLQAFLFQWAFERAGAPRSYKIAAVKTVSSVGRTRADFVKLFSQFCTGKKNANGNPAMDPRIADVDIPAVIRLIEKGKIGDAFALLKLRGIGHKLRALFLRDLICICGSEHLLGNRLEDYLWCQPVDVWVRLAAGALGPFASPLAIKAAAYGSNSKDLQTASSLILRAFAAQVSPLRLNQGTWYFAANIVADDQRLSALLRAFDVNVLENELALMKGFLPR